MQLKIIYAVICCETLFNIEMHAEEYYFKYSSAFLLENYDSAASSIARIFSGGTSSRITP